MLKSLVHIEPHESSDEREAQLADEAITRDTSPEKLHIENRHPGTKAFSDRRLIFCAQCAHERGLYPWNNIDEIAERLRGLPSRSFENLTAILFTRRERFGGYHEFRDLVSLLGTEEEKFEILCTGLLRLQSDRERDAACGFIKHMISANMFETLDHYREFIDEVISITRFFSDLTAKEERLSDEENREPIATFTHAELAASKYESVRLILKHSEHPLEDIALLNSGTVRELFTPEALEAHYQTSERRLYLGVVLPKNIDVRFNTLTIASVDTFAFPILHPDIKC